MINRIVRGRSFKGVGQYVLHDKKAMSSERVTFSETVNLPTANANSAIAHMIDTATHADTLKREAGISTAGRKQERPVYHYTLAWHPSETLTMERQMDAARQSLKALGLDDRQALIVGHNDTKHPHVHVVVNLVSMENGTFPSLSKDYDKLSKWALNYERENGVVFCKEREANQDRRQKGEYVKDQSMTRQEWEAWKKSQTKDIWDSFRADRAKANDRRKGQYDALWRQKESMLRQRKEEIKALYKPKWRDLFKKQRYELKNFDAGFFDRLGFAMTRGGRSKIVGFLQALTNDGDLRADFVREQEREKRSLGQEHKSRIADASRQVRRLWEMDRDALKDMHNETDQRAYEATKAKSAEVWQQPAPEQSKPDFEKSSDRRDKTKKTKRHSLKAFLGGDEQEIAKARQQVKKRRERERKRNRTRKRDRGDTGRTMD